MNRLTHFLILIIPPLAIPFLAQDEQTIIRWFLIYAGVVIPISTIWRMKSLGYSNTMILNSFIPFYGLRNRLLIFKSNPDKGNKPS